MRPFWYSGTHNNNTNGSCKLQLLRLKNLPFSIKQSVVFKEISWLQICSLLKNQDTLSGLDTTLNIAIGNPFQPWT